MMTSKTRALALSATLATLLTTASPAIALADDAAAPGTSTTSVAGAPQGLLDRINISYFGIFSGPSLTNVGTYQISPKDGNVDPTSPQVLYNQLKLDYKFNDNVFVGALINANVRPFGPFGGDTTAANPTANMLDSGVRIGAKHLIKSGNLNLFADLRISAPLDQTIMPHIGNLTSVQNLTYEIPKTPVTLGVLSIDSFTAFQPEVPSMANPGLLSKKDLDMYLGPNVSYQLTKPLALTLWFEFDVTQSLGKALVSQPMDIAPGVSWDVSPKLNLSPQLVIYPGQLNAIGTVMYISGKFL